MARDPEWLRHSTRLTLDRAGDPLCPSPVGSAPRRLPGAGRHCVNLAAFRADLADGAKGAAPACRATGRPCSVTTTVDLCLTSCTQRLSWVFNSRMPTRRTDLAAASPMPLL